MIYCKDEPLKLICQIVKLWHIFKTFAIIEGMSYVILAAKLVPRNDIYLSL